MKPTPLTDEEIVAINDKHYNLAFRNFEADNAIARDIEAAVNAKWDAENAALVEALKSAIVAMDNCLYAVADVALTDDLNDYRATIEQARAALAKIGEN